MDMERFPRRRAAKCWLTRRHFMGMGNLGHIRSYARYATRNPHFPAVARPQPGRRMAFGAIMFRGIAVRAMDRTKRPRPEEPCEAGRLEGRATKIIPSFETAA